MKKINPIKIESEHLSTYNKIKKYIKKNKKMPPKTKFYGWIAKDHIKEYGCKYYHELVEMEEELKEKRRKKRCKR